MRDEKFMVPDGAFVRRRVDISRKSLKYRVKWPRLDRRSRALMSGRYRMECLTSSHVFYISQETLLSDFELTFDDGGGFGG